MSNIRYQNLNEALENWEYQGFSLCGARKQGGYYEVEAEHPEHNNLVARGRTLTTAIQGMERQIDSMYGKH